MLNLIKSCLGQTDEEYIQVLKDVLAQAEQFDEGYGLQLLVPREIEIAEYLIESYATAKKIATQDFVEDNFPFAKESLENSKEVDKKNLRNYGMGTLRSRLDRRIAERMRDISDDILTNGYSNAKGEELDNLRRAAEIAQIKKIKPFDWRKEYAEKLLRVGGLITGVTEIDEKIGGMDAGTVTTIAGFTSHFKSTFAVNIAYLNSYKRGYNIGYITLETPPADMYWNLYSRHSYDPKFKDFSYISHDKIRQLKYGGLSDLDKLLTEVVDDLKPCTYTDAQGNKKKKGEIMFLGEDMFSSFSFSEVTQVLESLDDYFDGGMDALIVDYIQLCKFSGAMGIARDDNKMINAYVTFFRRIAQNFRSGDKKKKLSVIILAQINRESWKKARNSNGMYDITCLADANELERGSHRVITTFTNEEMKGRGEATVQILKNRNGITMYEPSPVYVNPECYLYGEDVSGMGMTFGGDFGTSLSGALDDAFSGGNFLESLGL